MSLFVNESSGDPRLSKQQSIDQRASAVVKVDEAAAADMGELTGVELWVIK